ncbi:MAG: chemotaxis protein CheW [Myxococcota bacterium]
MTGIDLQAAESILIFDVGATARPGAAAGAYGIDVTQVLMVLEPGNVSSVPLAPEIVIGIMNHHGRIVTVVDPTAILGMRAQDLEGPDTRVILLRQGQRNTGNVGLRVARVREIMPIAELKRATACDHAAGPCVGWVAQHGRRLINILRVDAFLEGLAREFGSSSAREPRQGVG